jgi:hypothetical protein
VSQHYDGYGPMRNHERAQWEPVMDDTLQAFADHAIDVCGRALLYLPYTDASTRAAIRLARIMGWDEGSRLRRDHLKRIRREVVMRCWRRLDELHMADVPGRGLKRTTGGYPLNILFTNDDAEHPMGWVRLTPRDAGNPAYCDVYEENTFLGRVSEIPSNRWRNPNRTHPIYFQGELRNPNGSPRAAGEFRLRRRMTYASDAAMEPGELRDEASRLGRVADGIRNRAGFLAHTAKYIEREAGVLGPGGLRTVGTIAAADGLSAQDVMVQLAIEFYAA